MNIEDFNADVEMEWDSFNKHLADYDGESEEVVCLNWNSFKDVAYDFYVLGKQSKEPVSHDLEEAAEELFETIEIQEHENIFEDTFKKIFIAGAEWQKSRLTVDDIQMIVTIADHMLEVLKPGEHAQKYPTKESYYSAILEEYNRLKQ